MSTQITQLVIEYIVYGLDIARRRWYLLLLPILIGLPLAIAVAKLTPKNYTAKSLILLKSTAPEGTPINRQQALEQVLAMEAWVKSDHVMLSLLPKISDLKSFSDPAKTTIALDITRKQIKFELLGGSAVEISLSGGHPDGLGNKLEIIMGRIMEGLIGPDKGIFTAPQFVLLKRTEYLSNMKSKLYEEISKAGLQSPPIIEERLQALYQLEQTNIDTTSPDNGATDALTEQKQNILRLISEDPQIVARLVSLYTDYRHSLAEYNDLRNHISPQSENYLSVLSGTGMVIVGRPKDPIFGENKGKKYAIALLFLFMVATGGLILLLELFYPGVHLRQEFESLADLPVISRFQSLN